MDRATKSGKTEKAEARASAGSTLLECCPKVPRENDPAAIQVQLMPDNT